MSPHLATAIEAAKIGAATASQYFESELQVEYKSDNSPVTTADFESEKAIKQYISSQFTDANFLAEETASSIPANDFWVIDPVDGTNSFIRGIPFWFVLVSYYRNNQIQLGVCYFPLLKQLL